MSVNKEIVESLCIELQQLCTDLDLTGEYLKNTCLTNTQTHQLPSNKPEFDQTMLGLGRLSFFTQNID
ncbi:hypothetical protein [Candidatus Nitrosacidococcus tergens]|uniref:Uncharacterized protein n=1 Tax=Candidatus Nitrosacidococcus tergens TaxID=553981 RepID=A0A7G1Q8Q7_9GAMM|nr:hypothetical protein [Candidatus Nitrosacidococcus tergens]CAB1275380.1 conserved protein of unknown function [Candidatus Nitrosacidococcus tergens]